MSIIFPPTALRATREFEEAVYYALQRTTDNEKFIELQHVFKEFGYYYPYWIVTGGKFLYSTFGRPPATTKEIIEKVITKTGYWEAFGGDPNLLRNIDDPDVDGWLESTATRQVLINLFDINPVYDLLGNGVRSEVQRIYKIQYSQPTPQADPLIKTDNSTLNTLICLSQTHGKIGIAKGVHFGGSLSAEDAVELVHETDITKLMRLVSVAGKPRVEYMERRTVLGSSINTHAFLPNDFLDGSAEDSGFVKAATMHHMESNGGELQPSTRQVRYFVMYVTYRELVFDPKYTKGTDKFKQAVTKALNMKLDKEKYQELQKVFGRFGYYYPSSISLGGRMVYKAFPDSPSGVSSSNDWIESIDILLKRCNLEYHFRSDNDIEIETIGGGSLFTGCQDWIDSVQTNQTRIQFGTLRPIYELLEDEQRVQVLRLYDGSHRYVDSFPEIPKGLHFDGTEAEDQVIEFTEDTTNSKMIMLRNFSDQPNIEHVKRHLKGVRDIENYLSLDIDTYRELPGSAGFVLGSEGVYKEQSIAHEHHYSKPEATYNVAYVTLHLYDGFIRLTSQFKEAINKALLVGKEDHDTYYALQDVFQRFGYYYPSSIQIGGRIALSVSSQNQEDQNSAQDKDLDIFFGELSEHSVVHETQIVEIPQLEVDNQESVELESNGDIVKTDKSLSKNLVINAIETSLAQSNHWSSLGRCAFQGGDSDVLLSNDIKGWINTVKLNQTTVQRQGLKPVYELLDEEQRHKVQQTYENVIIEDVRVRYDYVLEVISYKDKLKNDQANSRKNIHTPTDALFEQLLTQVFPDKIIAIQFCRSACDDYGFSVIEEEVTDRIICIYCSRSALSERSLEVIQDEDQSFCQWGIMLFKNDEAQWQFQKLTNKDESMHNHPVTIRETRNHRDLRDTHKKSTRRTTHKKIIIKPVAGSPVYDQETADAQYVRYGDTVHLWLPDTSSGGCFISVDEVRIKIEGLAEEERLALRKKIESSEHRSLWKVVPFSPTSDEDNSKTDDKENITANYDYVRKNDLVMFESQVSLEGNVRVYLIFRPIKCAFMALSDFKGIEYEASGCCIKHINQYACLNNQKISQPKEYKPKEKIASMLKSDGKKTPRQYLEFGSSYMYGVYGVDINNEEALKYLQLAVDQGSRIALYELGNLYWRFKEYQKAVRMFEEAAQLSTKSVYCKLGDFYRTGFSIPYKTTSFTIPQNEKIAFMYYSIGGIFGDATAALRIGEYYENGHNEDFGVNHNKALQWYEYVSSQLEIPAAKLAVGRIKHILANATKDPSERDELRREAYEAFEKAAMDDPYAKFMVSVYISNGWGGQQPDPVLGFDMLLSLVETGVNMALHGIAKYYELGVGVERDLAKASAYRELAVRMAAQ
ncbi:hypothetical protein DFQ30_009321 [Apophysomyces sp. BC1015]|nr:hypothetical protein DFQ30_009321 [Apophysomyces sp. BC1015]